METDPQISTVPLREEGTQVIVDVPNTSNSEGEPLADAIEQVSSDAVQIAEIEANKEITVAAIEADTRVAIAEAQEETIQTQIEATRTQEEEISWLRNQVSELQMKVDIAESRLSSIQQAPQEQMEAAEEVTEALLNETIQESPSTPLSMSPQINEMQTEVSAENEEGEQVVIKARRKYIPI